MLFIYRRNLMPDFNTRKQIFLPIIFATIFIIGLAGGRFFTQKTLKNDTLQPVVSKLNSMLDFIESEYVDSISKEDIVEKAIPEILKELDPHSQYIPARELQSMNEPLEGNFDGIGIQFNIQEDTIVVISVIQSGPSEKIGLLAGDRIVKVNDTIVAGVKITNEKVIKKLKGKKGTTVNVKIRRKHEKELLSFDIIRDQIPLYSVDASFMLTGNIGYVKISKFAKTTQFEFRRAVSRLKKKGMTKIVVDLRGNGGGYLDAAIKLADEFLDDKKLIVFTKGKARPKTPYYATSFGFCQNMDVAVLIDEYSASASEIFAGALQDNDKGTIIGRRSFGKGLVQEPVVFNDGSELRLTIARYYTPTGRCIQKPYSKDLVEYYHDINNRFSNGEFEQADSSKFADSLKFTTPGGHTVYGGGGIMPDIFVPMDTSGYTPYLNKILNKGLVYKFAFHYTDNNRVKLKETGDVNVLEKYLDNQAVLNEFIDYVSKNGVPANQAQIEKSRTLIKIQVYAYIARNIFDDNGFYPIILSIDNTTNRAIQVLKNKK